MGDARIGNYQACCRLCLTEKHEPLASAFDDGALVHKLAAFLDIEITRHDKLSVMVCYQCISKVNSWVEYREQCMRNQSKLQYWFNQHDLLEMPVQVKLEPTDVLEVETHSDGEEYVLNQNGDVHEAVEPRIKPEPMEMEYNELDTPQFNLLDSEDSQNSSYSGKGKDPLGSKKCKICYKTFSSAGNRLRHERLLHGSKRNKAPVPVVEDHFMYRQPEPAPKLQAASKPAQPSTTNLDETEQRKIQFAAGLSLLRRDETPVSMESLSKIEVSYIEKCKAMVTMYQTMVCACHNAQHHHIKGLLSHLRSLRIWFPVFTCYHCMITFSDRSGFTKHNMNCKIGSLGALQRLSNLRKRSGIKIRLYQNYRCTSCKYMYSFHEEFCKHVDEEHLKDHLKDDGPLDGNFECSCGQNFDSIESYKDHVYVSCLVEYYCDICFITVKTLDEFKKHAEEVHDNSEGFILLQDDNYIKKIKAPTMVNKGKAKKEVEISPERSKRRSSFYNKSIVEYDEEESKPKMAKTQQARLSSSLPQPVGDLRNPQRCPICDNMYSTYHNMLRHYRSHKESKSEKPKDNSLYSCPDCGGMYNAVEWKKHLAANHEPTPCDECDKVFQFKTELDHHRSVHLNIKISRDSKTKSYKSTMLSPNSSVVIKNEPGIKQFSCMPCNKHYVGYSGLWEHNRKKHPQDFQAPGKYPRQCKFCDKVCTTGASYTIHKQMHERMNHIARTVVTVKQENAETEEDSESQDYHTCKKCFKVFSSKGNLRNHMKSHGITPSTKTSKSPVKKVWCDICHISCDGLEKLKQHKDEEHIVVDDELPPSLVCQVETLEKKVPYIFTCDICVMTFTNKNALRKHKETHIREDKNPAMSSFSGYCKYCKIVFDSVEKLANHMREEHDEVLPSRVPKPKEKKTHVCQVCKREFNNPSALIAHSGWHKREPAIKNGKAAKVTKTERVVDKMVKSAQHKQKQQQQQKQQPKQQPKQQQQQQETSETTFKCKTCSQELPNETALQIHILERHRQIDAIMLVPRCNICNQDFASQDDYETHKRLHDLLERQKKHEAVSSPDCRFICPVCKRGFQKQNALTIHLKTHSKTKDQVVARPTPPKPANKNKFACSICNMSFNLPKDLRQHTINAHPF